MNWAIGSGVAIVAGTHGYMLLYPEPMTDDMRTAHAWLNLGASALILYGTM
jgi:hypothetical protein